MTTTQEPTSATETPRDGRIITDYRTDLVPLLRPLREAAGYPSAAGLSRLMGHAAALATMRETGKRTMNVPAALELLARLGVRVRLEADDNAPPAVRDFLAATTPKIGETA